VPIDLEISYYDKSVSEALSNFIQENDPEIVLITGDITTFGDRQSFGLAYEWLRPLLTRSNGHASRICVVVPGNHDVLQAQFAYLLQVMFPKLPWYAKWGINFWLRSIFTVLHELTSEVQVNSVSDIFNNFYHFEQRAGLTGKRVQYNFGGSQKLIVHPFGSVSTSPVWMNLGTVVTEELEKLNTALPKTKDLRAGELHLLALHHNPISSAAVVESPQVNAYNSMPAGVQLLSTLQRGGVDLVLHGHQHAQAIVNFDFDLKTAGHAYAIGVPSSASANGAGCNVIEVEDVNHVHLSTFCYRKDRHTFEKNEQWALCLERNRPVDAKTTTVRYEIKQYIADNQDGNEGALWDEVLLPGSELMYISGRHLSFVTNEYLNPLKRLLDHIGRTGGTYLRLLISDPVLLRRLAKSGESSQGTTSENHLSPHNGNGTSTPSIWGRVEDLEKLASEAEQAIKRLEGFVKGLSDDQRRRINVRKGHSLLPFGATVRDADKPWGKMVLRLLPVGAIGDISNPVIKLHRRKDRALYDHYFTHLKYLLANGTTILGDWDRGDGDLQLEGLPKPNPS
jgi:predicted MPP superfamily phosphohydrolase